MLGSVVADETSKNPTLQAVYLPHSIAKCAIEWGTQNLCGPPAHEHDTETNDDYFGARYYSSSFGRFLTPDWAATPEPIPYAKAGLPQTLNLYTYVQNNPITGIDPDGHEGPGSYEQAMQWANQVGERMADDFNKIPLPSDRGSQGMKGSGQMLLGGATIASIATGEPGPLVAVTGIMSGTTLFVKGATNLVGAATNTNVSAADKPLSAMSNPAGLVTTAATGGNFQAGQVAAQVQTLTMLGSGIVKDPGSIKNPTTIAKGVNAVVNVSQVAAQQTGSTKTQPSPPPPPTPKPPTCALTKGGCN